MLVGYLRCACWPSPTKELPASSIVTQKIVTAGGSPSSQDVMIDLFEL